MSAIAKAADCIPGYDPIATAPADCHYDAERAQDVIAFFNECLTHTKGSLAGQPLVLEPWEASIVQNAFGWLNADGTRRYREVFIFVPRKNGKTTLAAGVSLALLFLDGERGAEIYCAAADRDQASLVCSPASAMVRAEPELDERTQIYATSKTILYPETGSFVRAISADASTKHGYNSHGVIIDELHAQPNRDLVDVLVTSTGARRQPLIVYITTADYARDSICNEKLDYARKVRDGVIEDPSFMPVIFEAALDDEWTSPEIWQKANPNIGVSVSRTYLERECRRAQETPTYENTFKRLHLNITTEQDVRWLALEQWDRCAGDVDAEALRGKQCFAGLDMSSTTDISALVLYFPESGAVLPRFWIPGANARSRERRDRVPFLTWSRQGYLTMTEGNVVDYDQVRADVNELGKLYQIREIAIDRWNATQIMTQLQGDGFEMVPYGQGFRDMSAPTKHLEACVLGQKIAHGGNPVMRWMASNVMVEQDPAGNLKPSKSKSTEKIDGIVSLIMALGRAIVSDGDSKSVYETRGLREI